MSRPDKIMKFGGSSLSTPHSLEKVREIVAASLGAGERPAIVASALSGSTNMLLQMAQTAASAERAPYSARFEEFRALHQSLVRDSLTQTARERVEPLIDSLLDELQALLQGVALVHDISSKTIDLIASYGERLAANIVAEFLRSHFPTTRFVDSREIVRTDNTFGTANVDLEATREAVRRYFDNSEGLHVITGFIGATAAGETTTLGRGGSDYSAALIGAALEVDEIQIWTNVDGMMTADPRKVSKSFTIPFLSYEEAMELCHFGARVIYPRSLQPAMDANIPISIKNSFKPDVPGTLISARLPAGQFAVTGISSISRVALMLVEGSGMVGVAGVARRLFDALSRERISVILISQASSEHSICFAIEPGSAEAARRALAAEFALEIAAHRLKPVRVEQEKSIVAIVGANMRNTPGISGRVFQALGKNGINVTAIAQGSSELNISIVVDAADELKALNALHDQFFLSELKTIHLFMAGATGQVGAALLNQIAEQTDQFSKRNLEIKVVGAANSRRMLLQDGSGGAVDPGRLDQGDAADMGVFVGRMKELNLPNSIFVDCSASQEVADRYADILRSSISIVTPNKKANSSSLEVYRALKRHAERANVKFFYETNVGAGLPIINTLSDLIQSGDEIVRIEAVLSGTLSYIFNTFTPGTRFSDVVAEARRLGYTEPDPRDDLRGTDVARKLLILGREIGLPLELEDIEVESLVPPSCEQAESAEEFLSILPSADDQFEERCRAAHSHGQALRYIGSITDGRARVSLEAVDMQHPFYTLSGSDNIISFVSRRYHDRPLVVKGPGAGIDVTAAGVLADILRTASYLL